MQKKFRRLAAVMLCLTLLAVPAQAAEASIDVDYVTIVGEGEDVPTAVEAITRTTPDVVLLDVHMPGGGGIEVIKQVHATLPDTRFLAVSVSGAAADGIGVIPAAARGCVAKAISAVSRG